MEQLPDVNCAMSYNIMVKCIHPVIFENAQMPFSSSKSPKLSTQGSSEMQPKICSLETTGFIT